MVYMLHEIKKQIQKYTPSKLSSSVKLKQRHGQSDKEKGNEKGHDRVMRGTCMLIKGNNLFLMISLFDISYDD